MPVMRTHSAHTSQTSSPYYPPRLLAQDRDARRPSIAGLDDEMAQGIVHDLLDAGTVTLVVDQCAPMHEPSGAAFESMLQLAVFHEGWTAAMDAGEPKS